MEHKFFFTSSVGWAASIILDTETGQTVTNLRPPLVDPDDLSDDELTKVMNEIALWYIETHLQCAELHKN